MRGAGAGKGGAAMKSLKKLAQVVCASFQMPKPGNKVFVPPKPGSPEHTQWKAWLIHQSMYKAAADFDDFVALRADPEGHAHWLSGVLHFSVYKSPNQYDREFIAAALDLIELLYPNEKQTLLQQSFYRVLHETADDRDTWILDAFLGAGVSVDRHDTLILTARHAYPFEARMPQVVAVMRRLIEAGADPDKRWPELEGHSTRTFLSELQGLEGSPMLEALEAAEQGIVLDRLTKQVASAPVMKGRRL